MDFSNLTVLPRGRQIWDQIAFPATEYNMRKEKVWKIIDSMGVDGLLIYSDGLNRRFVNYLTNYTNSVSWSVSICIITKGSDPIIISTMAPRDVEYNKKSLPPQLELRAVGLSLTSNHHVSQKTIEYLKNSGMFDKKWGGVNLESLSVLGFQPFAESSIDLRDCTEEFSGLLARKSDREMSAISQAATMAKKAAMDYVRMAVPGKTEMQVAALIDRQLRVYGVENLSILVSSGKEELVLHLPTDRIIEVGDTVSVSVNVVYLHYNGSFATSVFRGVPDERRTAFYREVLELWENTKAKICDHAAVDEVNYCDEQHFVIVHGTGADLYEDPKPGNPNGRFSKGNAIILTAGVSKKGINGVVMSDTFAVDDHTLIPLSGPGSREINTDSV